ncbi:MAG: ABC transporter permease [Candidatus Bathyarchaeia archaeon]
MKENKPRRIKNEFLYFALRNRKLRLGVSIVIFFVFLAIVGPYFTPYDPWAYVGPPARPPSRTFWLGTTMFGQDVFTQFVYGLRPVFLVGILGGGLATFIGTMIGFLAGYRGGWVDEVLNTFTNVVLVIPTLALLLIIAAYLGVRSFFMQALFIGCTAWPWTARAVRAQTLSLKAREFVDLARISGMSPWRIILTEIAPNMLSYLVMVFILQFGGAILNAATLDFIGLGPTRGISLGLMIQIALLWGALPLGMWWWFIPPGLTIALLVGALYVTNVGLDEVFNPKLRET